MILSLGWGIAAAAEAERIPSGSGGFTFIDSRGNADKPLRVWTYVPEKLRPNAPVLFVMHGVRRNGKEYRDAWVDHAKSGAFLLIVPEFSVTDYSSEAYQRGNMFDDQGKSIPKAKWAYSAIEHLFDRVKELSGNRSARYYLYGHSAGGQFVHRFVLFLPEARIARAIAANPGYYTMPDFDVAFPYGLKGTTATQASLGRSLASSFVLMLGKEDTNREDPNLRKTPQADAQGKTRLERGQRYFRKSQQVADELKIGHRWTLQLVAGAGHSDKQMSGTAAKVLFRP